MINPTQMKYSFWRKGKAVFNCKRSYHFTRNNEHFSLFYLLRVLAVSLHKESLIFLIFLIRDLISSINKPVFPQTLIFSGLNNHLIITFHDGIDKFIQNVFLIVSKIIIIFLIRTRQSPNNLSDSLLYFSNENFN